MTPEARSSTLAVSLLAGLLLVLPWLQGGRTPSAQAALVLLLIAGAGGLLLVLPRPILRPTPLVLLAVALVTASAVRTMYPDRSVAAVLLLTGYLLAAVLAAQTARTLPWAESALLAAVAGSGLCVAAGGAVTLLRGTDGGLYGRLLTGPFGYPNATAGFLLAAAGAAAALATSPATWLRLAAGGAAGLLLLGLGLTHSRGALLAAATAILVFVWLAGRRRGRGWLSGVVASGALLLLLGVSAALWRELLSALSTSTAGSSAGWRLHILTWTWLLVREQPWTGVGPGAFPVALKHVQALPYISGENPHNLYLEIAAEYGLPAAMLAVLLLATLLLRLAVVLRGAHTPGPGRRRLAVLTATLAGLAAHGGMETFTAFPVIPLAAATLGGLSVARAGLFRAQRRRSPRAWRTWLLLPLLLLGVVALARFFAAAEVELGRLALAEGRGAEAAADLQRALLLNPVGFGAHRWLARALLAQGRTAEAVRVAERALGIAPRDPDTQELAGETFASAGAWEAAALRYRAALDLAPATRLRYYSGLLEAMTRTGRPAEARWWFERATRIFTPERLAAEGRCLEPGDRYLLARMARLAARLYAEAGYSAQHARADSLARALHEPEPRGICAAAGRPGQTSPETAVVTFWRTLSVSGWGEARRLLLPGALHDAEVPRPRGEVTWIASLSGDERRVTLRYGAVLDVPTPEERCLSTSLLFTPGGWFLEHLPVIGARACEDY